MRYGQMTEPSYAYEIFRTHFARAGAPANFAALELGPGDSVATAVIAAAHGATQTVLVDEGRWAVEDVTLYRRVAEFLRSEGHTPPDLSTARTLEDVLRACNAVYLTHGLASLRRLPARSMDFAFSNAVMEHVKRDEVGAVIEELARLLAHNGRCSHTIDLRDHLGDALNHMRISVERWESPVVTRAGLYTNRLTYKDFLERFCAAGLEVQRMELTRWPRIPTPRLKLAPPFRDYEEDVLRVRTFDVVLSPR